MRKHVYIRHAALKGRRVSQMLTLVYLLVCLPGLAQAEVLTDAYSYRDDFHDTNGLNLTESQGIECKNGALAAQQAQAVAVSECIRLPQPEGGAFQRWSFAELELTNGAGGSLAIQDCAGQTLMTIAELTEGQNLIALGDEFPDAIRWQWAAGQAGAALEAWNLYGQSEGVTGLQTLPPEQPQAGETVTFTLHVSSSGAITRNPLLRFSLDDINGLHTPDVDDGLAEDAENDYGSGVAPYKPLEFVSASAGPHGEPPQTPVIGATSGDILWQLEDLSDGFSDDLTVVLRIPKGYIHGKTLAAKAVLKHGVSPINRMMETAVSDAVAVHAVQAVHQRSWSPYSRVGIGAPNIYDWYAIWNDEVASQHASDIEDVTVTISSASACQPLFRDLMIKNPYNAFQILRRPDAGSPISVENPVIIHFDRADFHNETTAVAVFYDIPAGCPAGSTIMTQADIAGALPAWSDYDMKAHPTPEPGGADCRSGGNITMRVASGNLHDDYALWPAWDEFFIPDGSLKAGEYFITESPRGSVEFRTQVSTIEHSYVLVDVPPEVTFHGVRDFETPDGRMKHWLSRLYKDSSGTALIPTHADFDHDDPRNSGWHAVDITWTGEPFSDAPNDLNERAVVGPGCRLLGVKDTDNPAWQGPDNGNWNPYFLWRICDGEYGCQEPPDGTKMSLVGGTIYTYSSSWQTGAQYCHSYGGWTLYKENASWPKVYSWAETNQIPAGQTAHIILSPENENLASVYPEGQWGFNLYDVRQYVDLTGLSGEVISEGLNIPQPDQNVMGASCDINAITFHLPDAQACLTASDPDDPACLAWWDVPAACQPPNGWGHQLEGNRSHNEYIEMYRFRLNLPILRTAPANTLLNLKAEIRTRDLAQLGADNAVVASRWDTSHYTAATPVNVLETPGVDADYAGPLSRKPGDAATYTLQLANSGNAPNNGIYGVIALPRQGVNGSDFTPQYGQAFVDQSSEEVEVEYATDASCLSEPLAATWTTMPLENTPRAGYLAQTVNTLPAESRCARLRRRPNPTEAFEPGDHLTGAVDMIIPDDEALIGKRLYSRALTGAAVALGAGTEVTPVETVPVRTLVDSGVMLALEKTALVDPTRAGYIQWSLRVKNVSGSIATQIRLSDDLPPDLQYVELAAPLPAGIHALSLPVSESSGRRIEAVAAELAPDDGAPGSGADELVLSFWTRIVPGLEAGSEINNCAAAAPANGQGANGCASVSTANLELSKTQHALDQNDDTALTNVFRGDIFTYTITAINQFEQAVFMMIHDAFDSYVEYLSGTLKVNDATASDAFIEDGLLEYHHAELLNPGETLTLSFGVQVKDIAPQAWMIENIAVVTPYLNPFDPSSYFVAQQTNATQAQVVVSDVATVPEPSTLLLVGGGILSGFAFLRKRRIFRP